MVEPLKQQTVIPVCIIGENCHPLSLRLAFVTKNIPVKYIKLFSPRQDTLEYNDYLN